MPGKIDGRDCPIDPNALVRLSTEIKSYFEQCGHQYECGCRDTLEEIGNAVGTIDRFMFAPGLGDELDVLWLLPEYECRFGYHPDYLEEVPAKHRLT